MAITVGNDGLSDVGAPLSWLLELPSKPTLVPIVTGAVELPGEGVGRYAGGGGPTDPEGRDGGTAPRPTDALAGGKFLIVRGAGGAMLSSSSSS